MKALKKLHVVIVIAVLLSLLVVIFQPLIPVEAKVYKGETKSTEALKAMTSMAAYGNINLKDISLTLENITLKAKQLKVTANEQYKDKQKIIVQLDDCEITTKYINATIKKLYLNVYVEYSKDGTTLKYWIDTMAKLSIYDIIKQLL